MYNAKMLFDRIMGFFVVRKKVIRACAGVKAPGLLVGGWIMVWWCHAQHAEQLDTMRMTFSRLRMDAESSVVICIFSGYYRFLRKISCTVSLGFRQKS